MMFIILIPCGVVKQFVAAGQKFEYGNTKGTIDELMISLIGFSETIELDDACGPQDNGDGTWTWIEDGIIQQI